jgi:hypothetical protein
MGFMDDLKESVKYARSYNEEQSEKSSVPPDYEPKPLHGQSDRN